jgi:alkanesulfonate monooxygenase
VAPSLVARKLITLDHLTGGGRVAIHHITGGDEPDQRREGDQLGHDDRYRRTGEFMTVLRAVLTSDEPVDFEGEFYWLVRDGAAAATSASATPVAAP